MCAFVRPLSIALAAAMLVHVPPAVAQQQVGQSTLVPRSNVPMSLAEFQGLSCAGAGTVTGLAALAYVRPIEEATMGIGTAMLATPIVATGFAVGCSVGATLAPAFLWAYRHFNE